MSLETSTTTHSWLSTYIYFAVKCDGNAILISSVWWKFDNIIPNKQKKKKKGERKQKIFENCETNRSRTASWCRIGKSNQRASWTTALLRVSCWATITNLQACDDDVGRQSDTRNKNANKGTKNYLAWSAVDYSFAWQTRQRHNPKSKQLCSSRWHTHRSVTANVDVDVISLDFDLHNNRTLVCERTP